MTKMKMPDLTEQELKYLKEMERKSETPQPRKHTERELEYLTALEKKQVQPPPKYDRNEGGNKRSLSDDQIKPPETKKTYKPPCDCGDPENCRVCCMIEAHKHRLAGDIPAFEKWLAKATGMWGNEVIKKHGGRSGFIG